jgi:hypothetical protein
MDLVAEEQNVGGHFEGESERERDAGYRSLVVVDIFRRDAGPDRGTYFVRVSLRRPSRPKQLTRFEADLDRYTSEADFLKAVEIGAGAIAEDQCDKYGEKWDCEFVAKQARVAAAELLHEINSQ